VPLIPTGVPDKPGRDNCVGAAGRTAPVVIPVLVTARNEERAIGACLASLSAAVRFARDAIADATFEICVVLDECTDGTESIARSRGVGTLDARGGKVEAQRVGVRAYPDAPFHVLCDADVTTSPDVLEGLWHAMTTSPRVRVAFPSKEPRAPRTTTRLARALHVYNARRGFSPQRSWFSGKLFAIRAWQVPEAAEIAARAAHLPASAFYDYAAPLRVDDIYLSRAIVAEGGLDALRESVGVVYFRAPETFRGMYRYHRRMQRELARIDGLFPELAASHCAHGARVPDLRGASRSERTAHRTFRAALALCRALYRLEHFAVDRLGIPARDPWPAIDETK